MDHLPHYSHITPVEVIDLHSTTHPMGHEQVSQRWGIEFRKKSPIILLVKPSTGYCCLACFGCQHGCRYRLHISHGIVSEARVFIRCSRVHCRSLRSVIAFFFNWLGFLAVVCLIPTIAARFGAMSGFGLSVVKWITVMRYHEFNNTSPMNNHFLTSGQRSPTHDPAQNFVFALVLFAGFFLFIRGLISYVAVKNRVNQQGQTADVFTWYWRTSGIQLIAFSPSHSRKTAAAKQKKRNSISKFFSFIFSLSLSISHMSFSIRLSSGK